MLSPVLLLIIILLTTTWRWRSGKHLKLYNMLKMNLKCYPIFGHSYLFIGSDEDRMNGIKTLGREAIKNDGVRAGWFANKLYSVVADPVIADVVLKNCLEKDYTMKFMKSFLGNGTLIAPVPIWRVRRKILTASFSVKNLNGFVNIFASESQIMADLLNTVGSKPLSIMRYLGPCAMDIVYGMNLLMKLSHTKGYKQLTAVCMGECIYGIKIGTQHRPEYRVLKAWDDFRDSVTSRGCRPWLHADWIYNSLPDSSKLQEHKRFLEKIADVPINNKMKGCQNNSDLNKSGSLQIKIKTFLDDLIRVSQRIGGYKKTELLEETFVLTLAAADSSTVGTSFACLMLARHPEVQEKVFEEIKDVFGDSTRPVTPEDLLKLKYLEAVIKETLRLYPPVPIIVREVINDLPIPSGVTLLPGTGSLINIWALHRNPRYWGADAEVFRAERFMGLRMEHPAQYMPFSYGPRNCLGPQFAMTLMKSMISTILRNFKILSANNENKELRVKFDLTQKDVDGFMVRLEPRELETQAS